MTMIRCAFDGCGLVMEARGNMDVLNAHIRDVHRPPVGWRVDTFAGHYDGDVLVTSPVLVPTDRQSVDSDEANRVLGGYYGPMSLRWAAGYHATWERLL